MQTTKVCARRNPIVLYTLIHIMGIRYWIKQLYKAFNSFYLLGAPSNLFDALVPQLKKEIQRWIREFASSLVFTPLVPFLIDIMRGGFLTLVFNKKVSSFIHRPRLSTPPTIQYLRWPPDVDMIPEIVSSFAGSTNWSTTTGIICIRSGHFSTEILRWR